MLKRLDQKTIDQITANTSIPSLTDIVKELIDNSLDSGCTLVRLEIVEGGTKSILVSDNGSGIPALNFKNLCKRGTTTKLQNFEDVFKIKSFGFRGQALSAISHLCDITLITKTKDDNNIYKVDYDNDGNIMREDILPENSDIYYNQRKFWKKNESNISGTLILIKNIYKNNNLRKQILQKNSDIYLHEISELIQSYVIINLKTNFEFYSQVNGDNKLIISTNNSNNTFLGRLEVIFGKNFADKLINFSFKSDIITVNGYLSKDIISGSKYNKSKPVKIYFVNGRKIDNIKCLDKIIINTYQKYNKSFNPSRIISLTVPEGGFDINMGEKKNEVIFMKQNEILNIFEQNLIKFHEEKMKLAAINENPDIKDKNNNAIMSQFLNQKLTKRDPSYMDEHDENKDEIIIHKNEPYEKEKFDNNKINNEEKDIIQNKSNDIEKNKDNMEIIDLEEEEEDNYNNYVDKNKNKDIINDNEKKKQSKMKIIEEEVLQGIDEHSQKKDITDNNNNKSINKFTYSNTEVKNPKFNFLYKNKNKEKENIISPIKNSQNSNEVNQLQNSFNPKLRYLQKMHNNKIKSQSNPSLNEDLFDFNSSKRTPKFNNNEEKSKSKSDSKEENEEEEEINNNKNDEVNVLEIFKQQNNNNDDNENFEKLSYENKYYYTPQNYNDFNNPDNDINTDEIKSKNPKEFYLKNITTSRSSIENRNNEKDNIQLNISNNNINNNNIDNSDTSKPEEKPQTKIESKVYTFKLKPLTKNQKENIFSQAHQKKIYSILNKEKKYSTPKSLTLETIEKEDFKKMSIVGQFNKGFIITELNKSLYIIDQHAADEKVNYEALLNDLEIKRQPTICPIKIEMFSIAEKNIIYSQKDLYSQLGFSIHKENNDFYITSFPSIYSYKFKYEDFINIVRKLQEKNYKIIEGEFKQNDLVKKLFLSDSVLKYIATKACRMSVMVGVALDKIEMEKILKNMANILSPWNCPHGRPTMRLLNKSDEYDTEEK